MDEALWRKQSPRCPVCPNQGDVSAEECLDRTRTTSNQTCHAFRCRSPHRVCAACLVDRRKKGPSIELLPVSSTYSDEGICSEHGDVGRTDGVVEAQPLPGSLTKLPDQDVLATATKRSVDSEDPLLEQEKRQKNQKRTLYAKSSPTPVVGPVSVIGWLSDKDKKDIHAFFDAHGLSTTYTPQFVAQFLTIPVELVATYWEELTNK